MFKDAEDCTEQEHTAQELYILILETALYFLTNAKKFDLHSLQQENPSYEELGKLAKRVAGMITLLVDDFDPMLHQKALEYASLMADMGKAITDGDEDKLGRIVDELDRKAML